MAELIGSELEDFGQTVFTRMGLTCIHRLNQVRLIDIDSSGPYSRDEHLELDYLIPYEDTCLVGEITGRSDSSDVENKYRQFRRHFDMVRRLVPNESIWQSIGVPDAYLNRFRKISNIKGFFITTRLQRFDVNLSEVAGIACFYRIDWQLIEQYSQAIGRYTKYHFLHRFDIPEAIPRRSLTLRKDLHNLMRTPDKRIASGEVGPADVYTFEASPYELLPMARVYRRDELPSLSPEPARDYQRPLIPKKLRSIRDKLVETQDFMFPNSILVVLSSDCRYESETLIIPERYGAIEVIDGQHRLFSYADEDVRRRIGDDARIMVTGIQFRDADEHAIRRYSARTFIEINTNQTRIRPTHLDAIAYPILGVTDPRAIAAQIILRANERSGSSLYGLFDTNQTGLGIIQATTVIVALKSITNINTIKNLQNATRGNPLDKRKGYENLFGCSIKEVAKPEELINRGVACFEQYFNRVAGVFKHDWPKRGQTRGSSLEYAKMIAGFVKLLWQFICEGLDWDAVQSELDNIRTNIMALRDMQEYDVILFDPDKPEIPGAEPSAPDDYRFLDRNRRRPTSIQEVIAEKRGR